MSPEAALVDALAAAAGDTLVAVVHFGSQLVGTSPDARSAHDLFAIVAAYGDFYRRTRRVAPVPAGPVLGAILNRVLPPNILYQPAPSGPAPGAKLFVITEHDLAHSIARGPDHFCRGRLMQRVAVIHASDAGARQRIEAIVDRNRRETILWVRPHASGSFGIEAYCRRMLEVSYEGEIRPESKQRREEVFDAQGDFWRETYGPIVEEAADVGLLVREGDRFRYARPAAPVDRLLGRLYFVRSKLRATLRWGKYMLTFDRWLEYVAAKAERRTGLRLNLTEREKRWPFLFAWPKLLRVLRARRAGGDG